MSYGPGGYEDDWDEDEFDFGDYSDEHSSAKNYYSSENNENHIKQNDEPSSRTFNGHGTSSQNETQNTTATKVSFGRGRGRGGFSTPNKTQSIARKNKKSSAKNTDQGNVLFARTSSGNISSKRVLDERNSQLAEDLRAATLNGDGGIIKNILDQGISVDYILKTGWTALMHAANCGFLPVIDLLIGRGANVNFHRDMFTVLMAACSSECDIEEDLVQCVNHLIEKGAKVDSHDRYHMTPLMYACRNGRGQIVDVLLRNKSDINKQDQRGWSALCWAASRGHGRIVRMLLDENANPKQYTNDGQSAEDLAYDGGFNTIANILNVAVNPSQRQVDQNLMQSGSGSEGASLRYGDMELFLFGLELGHLVPLFQAQKINFDGFLKLNDADLQQIGVSQIGIRKQILSAIHDVHTKSWDLSTLPSQQLTNKFTSDDLNLVLANVEKHLIYIQCSVGYASKSLRALQDPTVAIQDMEHAQQFLNGTKNVSKALNGIRDEIVGLASSINKISSDVPCSPADLISVDPTEKGERNSSLFLPALIVGGSLAIGLTVAWFSRD